MIMYLCMKYESNTQMFSKDIARKPFFVRTGQDVRTYVCTYGRTDKGDAICPTPPIINGGGITKRYGRTDGRTHARTDVKTVYPTTNKVCGGYNKKRKYDFCLVPLHIYQMNECITLHIPSFMSDINFVRK